jgi:hypothetical protein
LDVTIQLLDGAAPFSDVAVAALQTHKTTIAEMRAPNSWSRVHFAPIAYAQRLAHQQVFNEFAARVNALRL